MAFRQPIVPLFSDPEAVLNVLRSSAFFKVLNAEETRAMLKYVKKIVEVKAGEMLFREGDPGDFMCFIASGSCEVVKTTHNGKRHVRLAVLTQGKTFGEMSLIDDFPRSASVRAIVNSLLIVFTREQYEKMLKDAPEIGVKVQRSLLKMLSLHLRKTSGSFVEFVDSVWDKRQVRAPAGE